MFIGTAVKLPNNSQEVLVRLHHPATDKLAYSSAVYDSDLGFQLTPFDLEIPEGWAVTGWTNELPHTLVKVKKQ